MASRSDSDVKAGICCVRRAAKKVGLTVRELFKRALKEEDPREVEGEIEEFERLDTKADARIPRNYTVPGPVVALAGAIERHSNPQVLLKAS